MNSEKAAEDLRRGLEKAGFRISLVAVDRIAELHAHLACLLEEGQLKRPFYDGYLTGFEYGPPEDFPGARSVIVAAARQPKVRVRFKHAGRFRSYVIPPTYDNSIDPMVLGTIRRSLDGHGYEARGARLPWKSLAVRSGLAAYGRNNITYVEGWGSYFRLTGFYSDLPCDEAVWQEPAAMEACEHCTACHEACPSGAVGKERFLIRAERCITLYNEETPEFPDWIDRAWHNSLVGCMICQDICPANAANVDWQEGDVDFSEEETGLLVEAMPLDRLPAEAARKLEAAGLLVAYEVLPRNLRVLLEAD
jgi:epoxyqueuosine reductase